MENEDGAIGEIVTWQKGPKVRKEKHVSIATVWFL